MTKREQRVLNAFINCVRSGEFTPDYAILLIEDNQRYSYLSNQTRDLFYDFLGSFESEQAVKPGDEVNELGVASGTATTGAKATEAAESDPLSEDGAEEEESTTESEDAPEGENSAENEDAETAEDATTAEVNEDD